MWKKIQNPVYLMVFSVVVAIADLILERFFNIYLVYFGIHVLWVTPVLFIIGFVWLIIALIRK